MTLIAVLLAGALAAPAEDGPRPRIHLPTTELDFGTLFQGEAMARTFLVENHGDGPLVIDKIKPNCGCAAARVLIGDPVREIKLDRTALIGGTPIFSLEPGESAEIEVTYDASGQPPRPMRKRILLGTNDPDRKAAEVFLRVQVQLALTVDPRPARIDAVRRGEPLVQDVSVRVSPGLDLNVVAVENGDDVISGTVEAVETADDARVFRVRVLVAASAPVGSYSRTLVLRTDHPTLTKVNLPVFANVLSAVRFATGNPVNDSLLSFGLLAPGKDHRRVVEIVNENPEEPYTVLGVETDIDPRWKEHIDVELQDIEPGRHYLLAVTAKSGLAARFFRGTIKIRADHADQPVKVLQFNGRYATRR